MDHDIFLETVGKSINGDICSFEKLIAMLYPMLHRYVSSRIGIERSDDVLQDIMLLAWLNIGSLKSPAAFRKWLLRIAANRCAEAFRSSRSEEIPTEDETLISLVDRRMPAAGDAGYHDMQGLLSGLPEKQRQTLEEFYLGSLKVSEISFIHNIPAGTVKRRLHDGRKRLRKILEEIKNEEI